MTAAELRKEAFESGRAAYRTGASDYAPAAQPYGASPLRLDYWRGWRQAQQEDAPNPYRKGATK